MNETCFEPFGSSFHPDWRESRVQLTGKQAVLLMHNIYLFESFFSGFWWKMIKELFKLTSI